MKNWKRITASSLGAMFMSASAPAILAEETNSWRFELTPYIWAAGIDGDIDVRNQTGEVDVGFSDILDNLDAAAAFLGTAQYNRWVTWVQVDYLDMSADLKHRPARDSSVDSEMTMSTLGFGYQFNGFSPNQTIDVLLGARHLSLENELEIKSGLLAGNYSGDRSVTDPLLIVRPSIQLSSKWRFNPTLSYGSGGDSENTWEAQPQFQYQVWDNGAVRFGYRKVHYEIKTERGNGFDGNFSGAFIGFGWTFGAASM